VNESLLNLLVGVALVVSAAGIVVPILPGTFLAAGALLIWAIVTGGATAWGSFAVMALVLAAGQLLKYLLPHRSMTAAGVPGRSILVGGIAAIIGFFAIPVVGLVVGFVGGVYLAEHARLRQWEAARTSTWAAMKATGFSILIELGALLVTASIWAGALIVA
jgi:uncharacterized protein YqgC (DUF456 family)